MIKKILGLILGFFLCVMLINLVLIGMLIANLT